MLTELRVENLLLIEGAELCLAPGLNVLTGETGAGKTILAHALDLLLGGRARSGIVRPGAREAYVEGIFDLPDDLSADLSGRLPAGAGELVLARRVGADGRTRAFMNGRSTGVSDLRDAAAALIAFYGQHEHRKLTMASAQLEILDGYCGPGQGTDRGGCALADAQRRRAGAELHGLRERAGSRERELDLIDFELGEIEAAGPDEAEYEALRAERGRLRHLESLGRAAVAASVAVSGTPDPGLGSEGGIEGAAPVLALALGPLEDLAGVDPRLDELTQRCRGLLLEAQDVGSELGRYVESLGAEPGRLQAVEERLAVLERLMRKHGGTIASVLDRAREGRARRTELEQTEVQLAAAQAALADADEQIGRYARSLRRRRQRTAPRLAREVRRRLDELGMQGSTFEVVLEGREPGPTGADAVDFLIAPNPGVPAAPVREIASGGELSRVMLALMGAAESDGGATLVFDEIDAGIGGHAARAVGERLRLLSRRRQLLCITHLPQIASLAERHFSIAKDTSERPARATVSELAEREVVSELVRMLGSDSDDSAARRHAVRLRRAA